MKVKDLIKELQALKPELQNKEVVILTQDKRLYAEPTIKFIFKRYWTPVEGIVRETVDKIVIEGNIL